MDAILDWQSYFLDCSIWIDCGIWIAVLGLQNGDRWDCTDYEQFFVDG
jgi:hypothetical protein